MALPATLRRTVTTACLPALGALVALPAVAGARLPRGGTGGSGGGGLTTTSPTSPATAPGGADVIRLAGAVNASGDGITFTVAAAGTLGHPLTITGTAPTTDAGGTLTIEAARVGRSVWTPVAAAPVSSNGGFSVRWTPATGGQVALRAVLLLGAASAGSLTTSGAAGIPGVNGAAAAATSQIATSPLTIPIFRNAVATLYGPGFWGRHTACGERLTRATLGVASRTLKCGARVSILYDGRELTVPVIDRGPYAAGVTWDLTMATATALGITETSTIGTLSTRAPRAGAARG